MPVLSTTDRITPRSVIRHRPSAEDTAKGRENPASSIAPVAQRASRLRKGHTEDEQGGGQDIQEWKRTGADAREAKSARAPSAQAATTTGPKNLPKTPRPAASGTRMRLARRAHPLVLLGLGMILMLALWTGLTLAANWWGTTWDDIHYGRPRTFQTDAVVGHTDSTAYPSHFIALNLKGRIEVIEFPGGDASKARIYIGPQLYGDGSDLIPVTLSFVDVKGDHQPDMVIHFQATQIVYINAQGGFRPALPSELPAVEQYLQKHGP